MGRGTSDGMMVSRMKEVKPELSLSEKDLPEMKKWKIGKKYMLGMEVEMVSVSKGDFMGGDEHNARFKVLSVVPEAEGKKSKE